MVGHILIAEADVQLAGILAQHLETLGHRVTRVIDGGAALQALSAESFDVALLDIVMPAPDGLEILRALADDVDSPAIIVVTAPGTIDTAVQAMRLGAVAYLTKPYRMPELDVVVTRALEQRTLEHQNAALRLQVAGVDGDNAFLTQYAPLQAVFSLAVAAASRDTPMLIVGANGAGKCALARAVHARSSRVDRPFVLCTADVLAGPHLDRVLFGAERTSRMPAARGALGMRGTLYLAGVSAVPARVQLVVADAVRTKRYRVAGSGEERAVRARLIVASEVALDMTDAPVHPSFASALNETVVTLPRLAERVVDIPLLANAFLNARRAAHGVPAMRFDPDAITALQAYGWPGNVAELRAVVDRARLLAKGGVVRVHDLAIANGAPDLELAEVERRHISAVLHANAWHQGRAAESLGISPKTLYRKIREYGLRRPSGEGDA